MCLCCIVTEIFSVQYWRDSEIWVRVRSKSLEFWKWHRSLERIRGLTIRYDTIVGI